MKILNIPIICDRIAVQSPYFAFQKLEGETGTVRGEFVAEQGTGYEKGAVSTAEIGRHLAILGSCAAVTPEAEGKTFYLATKAKLSMLRCPQQKEEYQAVAEVVSQDKRTLVIQALASDGGPFAHLHCEYQILSDALFSKTFSKYRTEPVQTPTASPYRRPIDLDYSPPKGFALTAHSRPLPREHFAGHFSEFPSWPVAIIADTVSHVRSALLHHMLGREVSYTVASVTINAMRLISASETLAFCVECISASQVLSRFVFIGVVNRGDDIVATLEMEVYV